jgi:hypothetical protein
MNKIKRTEKGFSAVEILIAIVIIILVGVIGYMVFKNHQQAKTNQTNSKTINKGTLPGGTITTTTAGWKSYELTNEKLKFNYPPSWTIANGNPTAGDNIIISSNNIKIDLIVQGQGTCEPIGDSMASPIADSSTHITFAGQPGYLSFFHYFNGSIPANNKGQVMLIGLSTDKLGQACFPAKNVIIANKPAGIEIYMQYGIDKNDIPISYPLNTVLSSQDYQDFKLMVQSMAY